MRARHVALIAAVSLAACKKDRAAPGKTAVPARSAAAADALWALAPPDAQLGLVLTPRAMHLIEDGLTAVHALAEQPEMAMVAPQLETMMRELTGAPFTTFADAGIDRDRGLAVWQTSGGGTVAVIPVKDLARLRKRIGGPAEPDRIGGLTCRAHALGHLCATEAAMLDGLGKAAVPASVTAVGTRGDVELVIPATSTALIVELERGTMLLRGATAVPAQFAGVMRTTHRPRLQLGTTASFGMAEVRPLLEQMPDQPLVTGVGIRQLAATFAGPMTVTLAGGSTTPDLRVPLSDPVPATEMVARCDELVPADMRGAAAPGVCRLVIQDYGAMELDLWVDGNQLRIGSRDAARRDAAPAAAAPVPVALTPLAEEIAGGTWAFAFWGRGTVFGGSSTTALPPTMPGGAAMVARLMTLFNEVGMAVRLDGDHARFVVGVRTLWANPPAVSARLLAIPTADIVAGSPGHARAAAAAAPDAPFAQDLAAGQGGLMVPAAVVGMLAAVAIPAFLQYQQRAEAGE